MYVTTLIAVDVISRHNYLKSEYNATIQCIFHESRGLLSQSLNYWWLAIPQYLHYISLTFLLTGATEFICSQAPYSMKGVIIGAQYIHLYFNLFNPLGCNNCYSGILQKGSLEFGYWDHQLWILVCTTNNSCLHISPFSYF